MAQKQVDDQGIDYPETLASLSDEITVILEEIRMTSWSEGGCWKVGIKLLYWWQINSILLHMLSR